MNTLLTTFSILKEKGYSGKNDFFEISKWFHEKRIFVDWQTVWSDEGFEQVGYRITFWFNPYETPYSTSVMNSYEDAFYTGILAIKDLI